MQPPPPTRAPHPVNPPQPIDPVVRTTTTASSPTTTAAAKTTTTTSSRSHPNEEPGIQIPDLSDSTVPPGDGSNSNGSGNDHPSTTPPADGSNRREDVQASTQEDKGTVFCVTKTPQIQFSLTFREHFFEE